MSQEYVIVLTTLPADADGAAFARDLVEERLAACVNLSAPMESIYRWEGTVETESERQLVIKTSRERVGELWDRVRELHPYDMNFTRDVFLGRRRRVCVEANPQAHHRIGETVPLLSRDDEIDVFKPRQVILGRARRPS